MRTAGWTGAQWIQLLMLLAGHILADIRHEPLEPGSSWRSTHRQGEERVCRVRNWREAQYEYFSLPACTETRRRTHPRPPDESTPWDRPSVASSSAYSDPTAVHATAEHELDTDPFLEDVNFLSFDEWKKQNLAKAGQSAEMVGSKRADGTKNGDRQRPVVIDNALESLGEDAEIELDFGGFGAGSSDAAKPAAWVAGNDSKDTIHTGYNPREVDEESLSPGPAGAQVSQKRDAGTTCKQRFNYASFDCVATVLETNPECQGSSAVLTENKDSYMLNECRAKNKFLILELCEDILVDTVVLANYEFFSSIFRTFRVSVADRYPAKADQWKEIGVYEARNTREVQAFAVENPLIWARYLKIELLSHYGNEFYCPLSLIRVHGTTMLEEYKHDGDIARGITESTETASLTVIVSSNADLPSDTAPRDGDRLMVRDPVLDVCPNPLALAEDLLKGSSESHAECGFHIGYLKPRIDSGNPSPSEPQESNATAFTGRPVYIEPGSEIYVGMHNTQRPSAYIINTTRTYTTTTGPEIAQRDEIREPDVKSVSPSREEQVLPPEQTKPSTTQPPIPNPTTQESFFKSVNKRIQTLESNSTLSLLYIEEQSRILRDAFNKVEKRQLAKTATFLENLNITVHNELRQFREQYEQVWKSVAYELEHQRMQYNKETHALSLQFGVLADELMFQKRISMIQSLVILFCFGLVLFSRSAFSNYIELPSVQNMVSRSHSFRSSSPAFGSLPGSPSSIRTGSSRQGSRGHRRDLSGDSQDVPLSPQISYSPPTPVTVLLSETHVERAQDGAAVPAPDSLKLRSRSTSPVLAGGDRYFTKENLQEQTNTEDQ